jgi:hypothetical protein
MPNFVARVELHNALLPNYQTLHQQMQNREWVTWIEASGRRFHLPQGSYFSNAHADRQSAFNDASAAANATGRRSSILVTEGPSIIDGLVEIPPVPLRR